MVLWRRRDLYPPQGGSGTGSRLLHYFSTNRVDSRGLRGTPVDSAATDKRLTSNVLDHKLRVVSQLPKHARTGSTPCASTTATVMRSVSAVPASSKVACGSAPAAEQARTSEEVQERPARRFGSMVPLSAGHAYASLADARSSFGDNGGGGDGAPQRLISAWSWNVRTDKGLSPEVLRHHQLRKPRVSGSPPGSPTLRTRSISCSFFTPCHS